MRNSSLFLRILLASLLLLSPVNAPGSGIGKATIIAYEPQAASSISKLFTDGTSTDIVNVTEAGILFSIGVLVTTNATNGTTVASLDVTIDGGTTRSIVVYDGTVTGWANSFRSLASRSDTDAGQTAADTAVLIFNSPYLTSLVVAINVTTVDVGGAATFSVLRGIQL